MTGIGPIRVSLAVAAIAMAGANCLADASTRPAARPGPATGSSSATRPGTKGVTGRTSLGARPDGSLTGGSATTDLMIKMLAGILVVGVLGVAAVLVSRRLLPRLIRQRGRDLTVRETVSVGPRKYLHLVRVGDKTFLIGSTRERISMLAEVSDQVPGETAS